MNAVVVLLTVGTVVHKPGFSGLLGTVSATHKVPAKCPYSCCKEPRFFDVEWADNTTGNGYMAGDLVVVVPSAVESEAVAS